MKRNPKQAESNLYDCIPQTGPCLIGCSNRFHHRPGAFEYRELTDDGIPKEGQYWRRRDVE